MKYEQYHQLTAIEVRVRESIAVRRFDELRGIFQEAVIKPVSERLIFFLLPTQEQILDNLRRSYPLYVKGAE
jgi:hypothetical protein